MNAARGTLRRNQDVFRSANERLLVAVADQIEDTRPIPFLCECRDPACRSTVQLTVGQFRDLRQKQRYFAIVTGHPTLDDERIVETDGDVTIVVKAA